jgi:arabinose-5-phosphate isomerase
MKNSELRNVAIRVIKKEAEALSLLSENISETFPAVVNKINDQSGRVVLIGVGKSSHIAKKVASTFASTGTPAFFIHPTEASHGDLGMIMPNDIVIVFSKSGDSYELKDVLLYCKKKLIPIVAITAIMQSSLANASDFILLLPNIDEACTLGLAPTTSSIMMLAIGDALAVACLEINKFSKNDFKLFHPAGKIGLNLLKVSDIMHIGKEVPLISSEASMSDAILEMTRFRFGCVGVTDEAGSLIGIFTDGDLRRSLISVNLSSPISGLMVKNPELLDPNSYIVDAIKIFKNRRIPSAFVCSSTKPIGILHIHDILQKGFL